jgi:RNA polymerase sigma-70 factor (ECF subfamily)
VWAESADEVELWRSSLAGDGEAFGALFDLHRDRVFAHALRLTEMRPDAEDVTAAAFLELWRRRRDVRLVGGSVLPWLLVTATNVALNLARGTRWYRRLLAKLPRDTTAPDPAIEVAEEGVLGMDLGLRRSLLGLSEKDRHLVALVVIEGYPVADAAAFIGMSVTAAKSRLHRARARLRTSIAESPNPEGRVVTGGHP